MSILAHSLGSVLCYDVLCHQPPPASFPATPASPPAHPLPGGGGTGSGAAPASGFVPDSPGAALQRELSRLRAENRRLQLELEAAQAEGSGAVPAVPPTVQFR